jgi:uncharacterized glyoxalase superfamily protein PhnB
MRPSEHTFYTNTRSPVKRYPATTDTQPLQRFAIDVGDSASVDDGHADAVSRGLEVVYPLTDEPWGVRRFFVRDPTGAIVSVIAHIES